MKLKKKINISEFKVLIANSALMQFIELFTGTFLVTYFGRIAGNATVAVNSYYILFYVFLAGVSLVMGRFAAKHFRLAFFRIGIIFNIIYFAVFVFFGDAVVDHIGLVGTLAGISAALYWYPLALIKTMKIREADQARYFAGDRIAITLVAVLGPILLGGIIGSLSYSNTVYIVGAMAMLQLALSFLLFPLPEQEEKEYRLGKAAKFFFSDPKVRQVFLTHFVTGFTISGMALKNMETLVMTAAGLNDLEIGYATSASSIVTILAITAYSRMIEKEMDTGKYIMLCGLLPIISFIFSYFTGNLLLYLVFFVLSMSLPAVMHTRHTVFLYEKVAAGRPCENYRGEYFALLECTLTAGRCLGCALLIAVNLSGSPLLTDCATWFLVLMLGVLSFVTNRYRK